MASSHLVVGFTSWRAKTCNDDGLVTPMQETAEGGVSIGLRKGEELFCGSKRDSKDAGMERDVIAQQGISKTMAKINVLDMMSATLRLPSSPLPWRRPMISSRSPVYGEEYARVV